VRLFGLILTRYILNLTPILLLLFFRIIAQKDIRHVHFHFIPD